MKIAQARYLNVTITWNIANLYQYLKYYYKFNEIEKRARLGRPCATVSSLIETMKEKIGQNLIPKRKIHDSGAGLYTYRTIFCLVITKF